MWVYIKKIALNFSLHKTVFFLLIWFAKCKIVDSEYGIDIYKSIKIIIRTAMKSPKLLKFVLDHLKTKKMCKNAVKLPFVIRYVCDQWKTQNIW